jgi:hypothetical protein
MFARSGRDIGERLQILLGGVDQVRKRDAVIGVHTLKAHAELSPRQPGLAAHDRGGETGVAHDRNIYAGKFKNK